MTKIGSACWDMEMGWTTRCTLLPWDSFTEKGDISTSKALAKGMTSWKGGTQVEVTELPEAQV